MGYISILFAQIADPLRVALAVCAGAVMYAVPRKPYYILRAAFCVALIVAAATFVPRVSNDYNLSLGASKANWTADLVVSNLANSNVSQYTSGSQFITVETPPRPRTIGLQIGYKLGE